MNIIRGISGVGVAIFGVFYLIASIAYYSPQIENYYASFREIFPTDVIGITLGSISALAIGTIATLLFFFIVYLLIGLGFYIAMGKENKSEAG